MQAYDRDFFKSNDMIGEATINLKYIIEDTALVQQPLSFNKKFHTEVLIPNGYNKMDFDPKDETRFWLPLTFKNVKKGGNTEERGHVRVQVDVLPVSIADKNPVGKAR